MCIRDRYETLRSMILKTADQVQKTTAALTAKLEEEYVASSCLLYTSLYAAGEGIRRFGAERGAARAEGEVGQRVPERETAQGGRCV